MDPNSRHTAVDPGTAPERSQIPLRVRRPLRFRSAPSSDSATGPDVERRMTSGGVKVLRSGISAEIRPKIRDPAGARHPHHGHRQHGPDGIVRVRVVRLWLAKVLQLGHGVAMTPTQGISRSARNHPETAVEDMPGSHLRIRLRDVCNFVIGLLIAWLTTGRQSGHALRRPCYTG